MNSAVVPHRPGAALRWLRHRRAGGRNGPRVASRNAGIGILAFAAGLVVAPSTIGATDSGAVTHWGGWALETAFAGATLAGAWTTFRALEILFRAADAAALRPLPVPGRALALDRAAVAIRDAWAVFALVALFVGAAAFRPDALPYVGASLAYLALAALLVPAVALTTLIGAGVAAAVPKSGWAKLFGGGSASGLQAMYQIAPGAAFGATATLLLLLKLGTEEPLRLYTESGVFGWTNAATVAIVVPVALVVAAFGGALVSYARHNDALQARFSEAESVRPDAGRPYFSETAPDLDAWERRLGPRVAAFHRKDRLLLARRFPGLRAGVYVAVVLAIGLAWSGAVSAVGLALLGGVWIAVVVAPLRRVLRADQESPYGMGALLGAERERAVAGRFAAVRETLLHTALLAPAAFGFGWTPDAALFLAVWVSGAAGMCVAQIYGLRSEAAGWTAAAATAAVVGSQAGPLFAVVVTAVACNAAAAALYRAFPPRSTP